jgi:hypothetical protein
MGWFSRKPTQFPEGLEGVYEVDIDVLYRSGGTIDSIVEKLNNRASKSSTPIEISIFVKDRKVRFVWTTLSYWAR